MWRDKTNAPHPATFEYEAEIARHWQVRGCLAEGAPDVVSALAKKMNTRRDAYKADSPFAEHSQEAAKLAAAFLATSCAGNKGLSPEDTAILAKIRDESQPPLTPRSNPPNSVQHPNEGNRP